MFFHRPLNGARHVIAAAVAPRVPFARRHATSAVVASKARVWCAPQLRCRYAEAADGEIDTRFSDMPKRQTRVATHSCRRRDAADSRDAPRQRCRWEDVDIYDASAR